jgi:hypothetical protein
MTMNNHWELPDSLETELGTMSADHEGAVITGCRLEAAKAYAGVPELLQKVIDSNDSDAWEEIGRRIDYIYQHLDIAMTELDRRTGFAQQVNARLAAGKKLLFKPNIVGANCIDFVSHGEGLGSAITTDWTFFAALMRWFHDSFGISYYQMAMGEGSTTSGLMSRMFSDLSGQTITPEAVFEGKSGDFNGGWGFYHVRMYLAARHPSDHTDDPLQGYEESMKGRYYPPGSAGNRLMIYDLNNISDDPGRGRAVPVKDGANYQHITLHKVIIGGEPGNQADLKDYPGSVLVNVPKLKIHLQDLITNAIKNLGIGLYPMRCSSEKEGDTEWQYATPYTSTPTLKSKIPHTRRVIEMDHGTNLPVMGEHGEYRCTMTAGMPGTQADIVRATQDQGVLMVHVVDAIDTINISHDPDGRAVRIHEGYCWASLDCVALDLFCARYCFKTLPMKKGLHLKQEKGWTTEFVHHVPVAQVEGSCITTGTGLDSPLFRYNLYTYAEKRGIGQQQYHVAGWDGTTGTPMVTVGGHLGRVEGTKFLELMTETMYYNPGCMLWDMQLTLLSYARAHDALTGSSLIAEFMSRFDENQDGIIDYDETGRCGFWSISSIIAAFCHHLIISDPYGQLKGCFHQIANLSLRPAKKHWNPHGHHYTQDHLMMGTAFKAYELSKSDEVSEDLFVPGMKWGKGMWPGWETAFRLLMLDGIYGSSAPGSLSLQSLYGAAFQYADKSLAGGLHTGDATQRSSNPDSIGNYFAALAKGDEPLDFTLYVPEGYGSLNGQRIPNVIETSEPGKIFTAHFDKGQEIW